jgi:hypothetical protein
MSIQKIQTQTATGTQASFTFSNIPDKYDHLLIYCSTRRDSSSGTGSGSIQLNGDTTTSSGGTYKSSQMSHQSYYTGSPSPTTAAYSYTDRLEMFAAGNSSDTTYSFPGSVIRIFNYKDTNKYKYCMSRSSQFNNGGYSYHIYYQGVWMNTNAITEVKMFPQSGASFIAGSTATLYGVMAGTGGATELIN